MNTTQRLKLRAKLLVLALLMSTAGALVYTAAHAEVTGQWRVNLLKGSTTVQPYSAGATQEAAWAACVARVAAMPTPATYTCQTPRYVAVVTTAPVCPPQPLVESRQAECPAGQTGGWTQTRSYASVAAPTCWSAGSWVPVDPPTGACTVPPPVLSQPTLSAVRADSATAGRHNITLSWTVSENATTYSVERCTVALPAPAPAPCTNFAGLLGAGALTTLSFANTNLPAGFSYSYRLRGREGLRDLSSPYSNVVTIVIPAEVAPPPPTPVTGQTTITVVPNPTYTNGQPALLGGHWLYWTSVESPLPKAIRLPPTETSYVFKAAPGFYTFYVFAFDRDGNMGLQSDFVTKAIQ